MFLFICLILGQVRGGPDGMFVPPRQRGEPQLLQGSSRNDCFLMCGGAVSSHIRLTFVSDRLLPGSVWSSPELLEVHFSYLGIFPSLYIF